MNKARKATRSLLRACGKYALGKWTQGPGQHGWEKPRSPEFQWATAGDLMNLCPP